MKRLRVGKHLWASLTVMVMLALSAMTALAQCAMCRASLEGSDGAAMAKGLNQGIIVLLIPPVAIFCAIFITAYKHRNAPNDEKKDVS